MSNITSIVKLLDSLIEAQKYYSNNRAKGEHFDCIPMLAAGMTGESTASVVSAYEANLEKYTEFCPFGKDRECTTCAMSSDNFNVAAEAKAILETLYLVEES